MGNGFVGTRTSTEGNLRRLMVGAVVLALATLEPLAAGADVAPVWTDRELLRFADVVVVGEVSRVTARWDDAVAGIYTYVPCASTRS